MSKTIGSKEYNEWLNSPLTKALKRSFEQSITDPENQPSQYGTVTLEYMQKEIDAMIAEAGELMRERVADIAFLNQQLAAAQAREVKLREAFQTYIDEHEECTDADDWMAMMCPIEAHHVADEALAQPTDTSALETLIANAVKESNDRLHEERELWDRMFADGVKKLERLELELDDCLYVLKALLDKQCNKIVTQKWAEILIRNKRATGASSAEDMCDEIRALPGVTLADLKGAE